MDSFSSLCVNKATSSIEISKKAVEKINATITKELNYNDFVGNDVLSYHCVWLFYLDLEN